MTYHPVSLFFSGWSVDYTPNNIFWNIKFVISHVPFYGCITRSLALREEWRLKPLEKREQKWVTLFSLPPFTNADIPQFKFLHSACSFFPFHSRSAWLSVRQLWFLCRNFNGNISGSFILSVPLCLAIIARQTDEEWAVVYRLNMAPTDKYFMIIEWIFL
jgi:hypothetical protein